MTAGPTSTTPGPWKSFCGTAASRQEFRLPVKTDPRLWMPGETRTVEVAAALPG